MPSVEYFKNKWNKDADGFNQWSELSTDEKIEFVQATCCLLLEEYLNFGAVICSDDEIEGHKELRRRVTAFLKF